MRIEGHEVTHEANGAGCWLWIDGVLICGGAGTDAEMASRLYGEIERSGSLPAPVLLRLTAGY